jgi:tetratricopeptide (TPR) repeat protein
MELSPSARIRAMLSLGPTILRLLSWPAQINPHYGPTSFPTNGATLLALATLLLVAIALAVGVRLAMRGDRRFMAAVLWTLVAFLPASNILVPTGQILAERTLYVPSIGIAFALGLALDALGARARLTAAWRAARVIAVGLVGVAIGAGLSRSARWSEVWRNHDALFAQMIGADSAGYRGYWLSGLEARSVGRMDDAASLLGRAYAMYPHDKGLAIDYAETLLVVGRSREERGEKAAAIAAYRELDRVASQDSTVRTSR